MKSQTKAHLRNFYFVIFNHQLEIIHHYSKLIIELSKAIDQFMFIH